jgi:acyl CoA:acetate/3-ketoacid CoA transferase beta subunit
MIMISEEEAKERIARRIAAEFDHSENRMVLNLGVGIPTIVSNYENNLNIYIRVENGMLGVGPLAGEGEGDWQLINAGRQIVTQTKG